MSFFLKQKLDYNIYEYSKICNLIHLWFSTFIDLTDFDSLFLCNPVKQLSQYRERVWHLQISFRPPHSVFVYPKYGACSSMVMPFGLKRRVVSLRIITHLLIFYINCLSSKSAKIRLNPIWYNINNVITLNVVNCDAKHSTSPI